ncbi:hypothetical protein NSK_007684 [Nannochloropsis salina CCMP1776]|uniref:Uncharacterized protein n=1 Tax=Nannochloropsis salina CCMP1776 TaxID=1027361 RepID=A0A4D9CPE9_9STRA|nr:hypothetical protein NSK_007684 [Nannochloropsis salina CCMP1776]|eukprot:TFJ81041.1 hypothetical protein NSK_007684 [Nannochloropsis salina CCMP1776]
MGLMGRGGSSTRSTGKIRVPASTQVKKANGFCDPPVNEEVTAELALSGLEGSSNGGKMLPEEEKEIIGFAKRLAANEKRERDQALKRLEVWMAKHKNLSEKDFLKIWKGLFYCMWMSDRVRVQQDLGGAISRLVHCFGRDSCRAHLFVGTFYRTVRREWPGLDQHRLDKFYSFMRRMLRECLRFAQQRAWSAEALVSVVFPLNAEVLQQPWPNGLRLHACDLILPELARVGGGELTTAQALEVLQPFLVAMATSADRVVAERARARILLDLVASKEAEGVEAGGKENVDAVSCMAGVDMEAVQATVFGLASSPATRERYRAALYEAHKAFQKLTGKKRADPAKAIRVSLPVVEAGNGVLMGPQGTERGGGGGEAGGGEEGESCIDSGNGVKKRKARAVLAVQPPQREDRMKRERTGTVDSKTLSRGKEAVDLRDSKVLGATATEKAVEGKAGVKKMTSMQKPAEKDGKSLEGMTQPTAKKRSIDLSSQKIERESSASKGNVDEEKAIAKSVTAKRLKADILGATGGNPNPKRKSEGDDAASNAARGSIAPKSSAKKVEAETNKAEEASQLPAMRHSQAPGKAMKKKDATASSTAPSPSNATTGKTEAAFIPSKTFTGGKPGYVYKKDRQGLGYYLDVGQRGGKKVRWGKVQVKLFNKDASPADGKRKTVSFMRESSGRGRGKTRVAGDKMGRGKGGRGPNNRRRAVSYF